MLSLRDIHRHEGPMHTFHATFQAIFQAIFLLVADGSRLVKCHGELDRWVVVRQRFWRADAVDCF